MYNEFACVFFKFVINHRSCVGSDSLVDITLPEVISLLNDENKFSMLFFFFFYRKDPRSGSVQSSSR